MRRGSDIANETFGRLTALYPVKKRTNCGHVRWRCKCACGASIIAGGNDLRAGKTTSCGCLCRERAIDLQGQSFGKLTVILRAANTERGGTRWKCRCECGVETTVRSDDLKRGKVKGCGRQQCRG
jgi:hypothetical protein